MSNQAIININLLKTTTTLSINSKDVGLEKLLKHINGVLGRMALAAKDFPEAKEQTEEDFLRFIVKKAALDFYDSEGDFREQAIKVIVGAYFKQNPSQFDKDEISIDILKFMESLKESEQFISPAFWRAVREFQNSKLMNSLPKSINQIVLHALLRGDVDLSNYQQEPSKQHLSRNFEDSFASFESNKIIH